MSQLPLRLSCQTTQSPEMRGATCCAAFVQIASGLSVVMS
jgi:hypothetical protein